MANGEVPPPLGNAPTPSDDVELPEPPASGHGPADEGDFSARRIFWLFTSLSCIGLLGMCISQVEPFYPAVAKAQFSATDFAIGVVIAVMPLTVAVFSQVVGVLLRPVGHFPILLLGLLTLSLSTIAFPWAPSMGMAGAIRCLQGVGAAAVQTPVVARATALFPRHMSTIMGLIETGTGVGWMVGPVVGGLLYQVGDYWLPFLVMGALNTGLILLVIAAQAIDGQKDRATGDSSQAGESDAATEQHTMAKPGMLTRLPIIVHCLSTVIMSISYGFLGPILANELSDSLGVGALGTGLIFALGAGVYSCMAPFSGWLADNVAGNRLLIFSGFVLNGASLLLFGPAPLIPAGSRSLQWTYKLTAMSFLGVGTSLTIPLVPDMVQSSKGWERAEERIAALWGTMFSIGEVLGPAVGGLLGQLLGFRLACASAGLFLLAWAGLLWALAVAKVMGWSCPSPIVRAAFRALGVFQGSGRAACLGGDSRSSEAEEPLLPEREEGGEAGAGGS